MPSQALFVKNVNATAGTARRRMRGSRPFVMTNLKTRTGLDEVITFIETKGMLKTAA